MGEKSILQTLKNVFSFSKTSEPTPENEGEHAGTDVSVEREPSTGTEDTIKGTAGDGSADAAAVPEGDGEMETDAEEPEADAEEPVESDAGGDPVTELNGIGPTYGDRLAEAGLGTVAALAGSDPETVADAAEAPESRASDWIEQAQNW